MSLQHKPRHYRGRNCEVSIVGRPWYIDVLVFVLTALWMGWTFTTIQQIGANIPLMVAAVGIGFLGILMLYGHRITYLRVKDWILVDLDHGQQTREQREQKDRQR